MVVLVNESAGMAWSSSAFAEAAADTCAAEASVATNTARMPGVTRFMLRLTVDVR